MEAIGKYKRAMALAERIKKRVLSEIQKEIMAIPDLKGVKRIDSGVYGFVNNPIAKARGLEKL